MARRTKREMELMENECTLYLLQTKNDYHKAYDLFIKDHLESNQQLPYYIKGMKDFLKVSEELAVKLNHKEQMKKSDQQRFEQKEIIINYIKGLSVTEMKEIYKQYKNNVSHSDKIVLNEVYFLKAGNDFQEKYIDQHMINVFQTIYRDLQPA